MKQILEFKANEAKCTALALLLENPVLREALALVEFTFRPAKPKVLAGNDPALALALAHAYSMGGYDAVARLHELTVRGTGPIKPPEEWGNLVEVDLNGKPKARSKRVA